jgi:hypothetical protein
MEESFVMACCNPACAWSGEMQDTVCQPHIWESLLCPVCHEVVAFVEDEDEDEEVPSP